MSLTTCLRKAGDAIDPADKKAILARAGALRKEGRKADEAARLAVDERIAQVRALIERVSGKAAVYTERDASQDRSDEEPTEQLPGADLRPGGDVPSDSRGDADERGNGASEAQRKRTDRLRQEGVPAEEVVPDALEAPAFSRGASFEERVDQLLDDKGGNAALLGAPPASLLSAGLPNKPLMVTKQVVEKMHFDHGLTRSQIKALPSLLSDALMVFKSRTVQGRFVVVTKAEQRGDPIIVAIAPDGRVEHIEANVIASAYGKERALPWLAQMARDGGLVAAQKKSALAWTSTRGLKLPSRSGSPTVPPALSAGQSGSVLGQLQAAIRKSADLSVPATQPSVNAPDDTPAASRAPAQPVAEPRVREVRRLVAEIAAAWSNAPRVVVVDSMADTEIPQVVRDEDRRQMSQGATGTPEGFIHRGTVYLVAGQLDSQDAVRRVLFHEALGHYGLRGVYGKELGTILDQLAERNAAKVRAKAMQYGLDYDKPADRRAAAEEVLAELAQTNPQIGWVRRAVAAIRAWLRKNVPALVGMRMTDAEIVREFLEPARAFVRGVQQRGGEQALAFGRNQQDFQDTEPAVREADGDGPAFSRTATMRLPTFTQQSIRDTFSDVMRPIGKVTWWDRTIGTQLNKAERFPEFKTVFDAVQGYHEDLSRLGNEAADEAPSILPKLDTWRDLKKRGLSAADAEAIAAPIFEGTLSEKRVFDDAELVERYKLTPEQIAQYREFLSAVNASLDQAVAADVLRYMGDVPLGFASMAMTDRAALRSKIDEFLAEQIAQAEGAEAKRLTGMREDITAKYERIDQLKAEGYAPLMRFGKYLVNVRDPESGESLYFSLFESQREANKMARDLASDPKFAKATIERGMLSQQEYELFAGIPVESLEMFAAAIGAANAEVYQEYLRLAKNNRSALKRLIERKGTAGFSEDVSRVLASFVTSNARLAAGSMNLQAAKKAAEGIKQGDVKDEAIALIKAVTTPNDTAAAARSLLFMNFIGGSAASAIVNLTQPVTMTAPYLSQWGGLTKASARIIAAAKGAATGRVRDAEMRDALKRAEADGIVSPQEIHHLQAEAMGSWGRNPMLKRAAFVWGSMFSLAEQFNRRVSFMAAYQTAKEEGIADPFAFAEKAVIETQGLYNRGNAANWARNPWGAAALTFKQFSTHYLEWMVRMYRSGPEGKRAVLYALALLALAGGAEGLPFAEDVNDLIDTLAQALGYDFNSKEAKRRFVAETLGMGNLAAEVATRGLTTIPGIPMDLSIRMGMGNLLPGTGLLLRSTTDPTRDFAELLGAAGGLGKQYLEAGKELLKGDVLDAGAKALPVALQNAVKGVRMYGDGYYRDTKDRKVMNTDELDALMKLIGFQPAKVAAESRKLSVEDRRIDLARNVESEIAAEWARGIVEDDQDTVRAARQKLKAWNLANPASKIQISIPQIRRRVREMRSTRAERFVKSAPKEMRQGVAEALQ